MAIAFYSLRYALRYRSLSSIRAVNGSPPSLVVPEYVLFNGDSKAPLIVTTYGTRANHQAIIELNLRIDAIYIHIYL